jgi:hypothetical protein
VEKLKAKIIKNVFNTIIETPFVQYAPQYWQKTS